MRKIIKEIAKIENIYPLTKEAEENLLRGYIRKLKRFDLAKYEKSMFKS